MGTADHTVEKLGNKVMNSLDWTVQAFVDGRISSETFLQFDGVASILKVLDAKAGWIQEDESKLLLRKARRRSRRPLGPLSSPCQRPPKAQS